MKRQLAPHFVVLLCIQLRLMRSLSSLGSVVEKEFDSEIMAMLKTLLSNQMPHPHTKTRLSHIL